MAPPPPPEITGEMLDHIAARVAEGIQVPAPTTPEITDAMLDQIAARVAERLGPGLFGEHMKDALAAAVRDTVRDVVSDTSERLVRDEIDRIRQQAERE